MDTRLESLIEKIKKEGIEQAKQKSEEIIKEARQKEKEIIQKAKEEAKGIREEGQREAEKFQKNAENSVKQAVRNLVLSVREKLTQIFDSILKQELKEALDSETLSKILEKIIEQWSKDKEKGLEILVSPKDREKIEKILFLKFKEKAQDRIEIKTSQSVEKGFQIGIKGQDTYYDFSDEGITEALSVFLNPALASLISDKENG